MTSPIPNKISLKDALCFIVDNRGRSAPTEPAGHALIATNCINNADLYPTYENVRYVSQRTFDNWFRAHPKPGDIILTNKGSQNGAVCLTPETVDFCIAQDMMALRPDHEKIDPLYLFAALRSEPIQNEIKRLNVDGVIPHFKKTDFDKLYVPLPAHSDQKRIGQLHFDLCFKIEMNRRMNETLEAMAQAIFRDWFVDFGPTRRKREGASDPVEIMGGLVSDANRAQALADLFPEKFGDDGLPVGWNRKPLLEEAHLISGGTPKTERKDYWDGGIAWASAKDVSQCGQTYLLATERHITATGLVNSSTKMVPKFSTVVVARGATTGRLCMFGEDMAMNQTCYALKSLAGRPFLLHNMFKSLIDELVQGAHGSVFDTITTKTLATGFVTETETVSGAFEGLAEPLYKAIENNSRQIQTLAATRDLLLPKLMSGEIRVGEAEELAEAAQ